ncbi:MAG: chromosomal replication initiator DnaA [Sulfitobacter sp.]
MAKQLGFDLPVRPARGRADFFVAPSNALAVALIDTWQNWPSGKMALSGPEGAGKTHLAHVWADLSGAQIIPAKGLTADAVPALAQCPLAVEDIPAINADPEAQTALFHLHNMMAASGLPLLLTGRGNVASWGISLPDLASRLQGATEATLDAPDDALLAAVMVKLLADRQLTPKPDLIPYLLGRIDRSFADAGRIVARLDAASIALKRPLTRSLAASVLDKSAS